MKLYEVVTMNLRNGMPEGDEFTHYLGFDLEKAKEIKSEYEIYAEREKNQVVEGRIFDISDDIKVDVVDLHLHNTILCDDDLYDEIINEMCKDFSYNEF